MVAAAELGVRILLALGIFLVPVAFVLALLLLAFSGAVGITLLRGREMDCGCFGGASAEKTTWFTVARNLVLTSMAIEVVWHPRRPCRCGRDPAPERLP